MNRRERRSENCMESEVEFQPVRLTLRERLALKQKNPEFETIVSQKEKPTPTPTSTIVINSSPKDLQKDRRVVNKNNGNTYEKDADKLLTDKKDDHFSSAKTEQTKPIETTQKKISLAPKLVEPQLSKNELARKSLIIEKQPRQHEKSETFEINASIDTNNNNSNNNNNKRDIVKEENFISNEDIVVESVNKKDEEYGYKRSEEFKVADGVKQVSIDKKPLNENLSRKINLLSKNETSDKESWMRPKSEMVKNTNFSLKIEPKRPMSVAHSNIEQKPSIDLKNRWSSADIKKTQPLAAGKLNQLTKFENPQAQAKTLKGIDDRKELPKPETKIEKPSTQNLNIGVKALTTTNKKSGLQETVESEAVEREAGLKTNLKNNEKFNVNVNSLQINSKGNSKPYTKTVENLPVSSISKIENVNNDDVERNSTECKKSDIQPNDAKERVVDGSVTDTVDTKNAVPRNAEQKEDESEKKVESIKPVSNLSSKMNETNQDKNYIEKILPGKQSELKTSSKENLMKEKVHPEGEKKTEKHSDKFASLKSKIGISHEKGKEEKNLPTDKRVSFDKKKTQNEERRDSKSEVLVSHDLGKNKHSTNSTKEEKKGFLDMFHSKSSSTHKTDDKNVTENSTQNNSDKKNALLQTKNVNVKVLTPVGSNVSVTTTCDESQAAVLAPNAMKELRLSLQQQQVAKLTVQLPKNDSPKKKQSKITNIFKAQDSAKKVEGGGNKMLNRASSNIDKLLQWITKRVNQYPAVNVTNYTTSWEDGIALCALMNYLLGDEALNPLAVSSTDRRHNFDMAIKAALEAGVPALIDADEMSKGNIDKLSMITYLHTVYKVLHHDKQPLQNVA